MLEKPVHDSLEKLEALSFIESGHDKYQLTPYMFEYIERQFNQNPDEKRDYMDIICSFYKAILHEYFEFIGRCNTQLDELLDEDKPKFPVLPHLNNYDSYM